MIKTKSKSSRAVRLNSSTTLLGRINNDLEFDILDIDKIVLEDLLDQADIRELKMNSLVEVTFEKRKMDKIVEAHKAMTVYGLRKLYKKETDHRYGMGWRIEREDDTAEIFESVEPYCGY